MRRVFMKGIAVCLFVAALTFPAGRAAPSAPAAETVKIGILDPLSGMFEPYGRAWRAAVQFAVDEQNANGGLQAER